MYCYTQCPQPCSRSPANHASSGDLWTLTGKSGPVSCGFTAPFSWVLVHSGFCLCPPRVYFPVLCKFWWLCGGVNGDLLKEGLCHTQVCCTQSHGPCDSPLRTRTSTGDTQHSSVSVSVGSLGPGAHKICLSPLSVSGRYGVSYHLAGARPLFSDVGYLLTVTQGLHSRHSSAHQFARASLPLDVGYLLTVAPVQRNHCSRTGR